MNQLYRGIIPIFVGMRTVFAVRLALWARSPFHGALNRSKRKNEATGSKSLFEVTED